jgi:hypothetical protein
LEEYLLGALVEIRLVCNLQRLSRQMLCRKQQYPIES